MKHCNTVVRGASICASAAIALLLVPKLAHAHWCNDLWQTNNNIVLKPATSTVEIPATGSGTLDVWLQNNMSWPLNGFKFSCNLTGGAQVAMKMDDTLNRNGTILAGETVKYALTITKTGGGSVKAADLNCSFSFVCGEANGYPSGGTAVAVVNPDGTTGKTDGLGKGNGQALDLAYGSQADFDTEAGMSSLIRLYCTGRGSWGKPADCTGETATCPGAKSASGGGSKMDHPHLAAAIEIAVRKAALGDKLAVTRKRLQCGVQADNDVAWAGLPLFALGYLGDDPAARTFMKGLTTDGKLGLIAKAALYVAGNPEDHAALAADVKAGLTSSDTYGAQACAAALGIADKDDDAVKKVLLPANQCVYPESNLKGLYANHLLFLAAMHRRGWASKANDRCAVTFYSDPQLPGATSCGDVKPPVDAGTPDAVGTDGFSVTPPSDVAPGTGGKTGTGGAAGSGGSGGQGGQDTTKTGGAGGNKSSTGGAGGKNTGGTAGTTTVAVDPGCQCNLGTHGSSNPMFYAFALLALWFVARRRQK